MIKDFGHSYTVLSTNIILFVSHLVIHKHFMHDRYSSGVMLCPVLNVSKLFEILARRRPMSYTMSGYQNVESKVKTL
jgi:hypothetical protein